MNENVFDLNRRQMLRLEEHIAELRTKYEAEIDQLRREKEALIAKIAELQFELGDLYERMPIEDSK